MRIKDDGNKILSIDKMRTGRNIARLREEAGITVRDLQLIFGFNHPQTIYSWQNGKCLPTVDNFIILSSVLGVTIDEMLVLEGDPETEDMDKVVHTMILS